MKKDKFIEERNLFAKQAGVPNLYDFIDHFPLYAGIHTIANKLWTYELLNKTTGIPGDIAEFGCWKGSNLMFLAKIMSVLEPNSPKKIFGFDNFSGLPEAVEADGPYASNQTGRYCGDEKALQEAIALFDLSDKVMLVVGDALQTIPKFHLENPHSVLSFAYLDFDLYEPTKAALKLIDDCLSVGGIVVFDEACTTEWPGETLAMKEFLKSTTKEFRAHSNSLSRQPTVALERVK